MAGDLSEKDELFLHIGLQYGSPFRPTFAILDPCDPTDPLDDPSPGYRLLRDTGTWVTATKAANMLHQSHTWHSQPYIVEDSLRPVSKMVPGVVSVQKMSLASVQIWPREPSAPRRRPRTPSSDHGSARALEDGALPDDGGDDDMDDSASEEGAVEGVASDAESVELEDDLVAVNADAEMDRMWGDLLAEMIEVQELPADAPAGDTLAEPALVEPEEAPGAASAGDPMFLFLFLFWVRGHTTLVASSSNKSKL